MATDNTSKIAGDYPGGIRITCILDEGAPTIVTSYDQQNRSQKTLTWASEIEEGDYVGISNDTAGTYAACGGIPLVETPVDKETLVIGRVRSTPRLVRFPAADADANDLSERLAGKYYRIALVEIYGGITKIKDAVVKSNGTNGVVQGVGTTLNFNITDSAAAKDLCFITAADKGVGVIPFHYMASGEAGDTATVLVGINGLMYAVTGS